ncbi:hypothetical protein KCH_51800 [Kitasatospora cheerisanensis KCTC 2395]|uniref:Uncharacterized protein n=1 Tax=Kitasatospora cheerisanensis KCTC 2395 TaxID=1348663 RepID=A0A066YSR8_9ACTN|nr:hypothetical protein KCH_51800 [Kitasatospora cheerisanensis KCTC 2395]
MVVPDLLCECPSHRIPSSRPLCRPSRDRRGLVPCRPVRLARHRDLPAGLSSMRTPWWGSALVFSRAADTKSGAFLGRLNLRLAD